MSFLKVIFWEFIQNLPVLAGFAWAFDLWQQGEFWAAIACVALGSLAGSALIALTEARKVAGHREPPAVLLANIIGMTVIALGMVAYLSAHWSSWLTDLAVGAAGGAGLGIVQSLAARKKVDLRHCLALGLAAPLVLVLVRWLLNTGWPVWVNILCMTALATVIIALIDYTPKKSSSGRLQ